MTMAASAVTSVPVDQLDRNRTIQPDYDDQSFWWEACRPSLATLLKTSNYHEQEQIYYSWWFRRSVTGFFGPRPINGKPYRASSFTYEGSPMEYSLNWKEKKASQTIRFTMEPCSNKAGTAADPFNQLAARDLLTNMANDVPSVELSGFNHFLSETNVPDGITEDEVFSKLPANHPRFRVLVAFDLELGKIVAKAYFNPEPKAICTGQTTNAIVLDAVRKFNNPFGSLDTCVEALHDYLKPYDGVEGAPYINMVSNDCVVVSPSTRIKVYINAPVSNLARIKDIFTLGGRLSGPAIVSGLKEVVDFWCHAFGLDGSDPEIGDKEVQPVGSRCVFGFELRPDTDPHAKNGPDMEAKLYLPGSWLGKTDAQVCKVLSSWFKAHDHPDFAARYQSDLVSAFPRHDISTPDKLSHTWISLTRTDKAGCYMSMYYTPRFPDLYYVNQ